MSVAKIEHPSVEERKAHGKAIAEAGTACPATAGWKPAADRPDPVALLEEQDATREPDLVPVRHGRMLVSPFTFYRGAAKIMAADLKDTPRAGLIAQLCGDAHLSNFGVFASPERALLFDLNDFDETLPGPVRVRREAHGRELHDRGTQQRLHEGRGARRDARLGAGLPRGDGRVRADGHDGHLVRPPVRARADGGHQTPRSGIRRRTRRRRRRRRKTREGGQEDVLKARTRDSLQALSKLAEHVDGNYRIVSSAADRDPGARAVRVLSACRPMSSSTRSTSSSAPTGPRCRTIDATARAVRGRRRRPQGRRRRQRRHAGVHRPAPGPRSAGSAVPPGQGGDGLGARGPSARRAATSSPASASCRASG